VKGEAAAMIGVARHVLRIVGSVARSPRAVSGSASFIPVLHCYDSSKGQTTIDRPLPPQSLPRLVSSLVVDPPPTIVRSGPK
jgi:hypothetical protein